MDLLTNDEWSYIMEFIKDNNDKCNLLRICKQMGNCKFYFYERVYPKKYKRSMWYNKFINVIVDDLVTLPLHIKSLTFGYCFNEPIKYYNIPLGVIHLTFGCHFNQPINDCIPSSVTHLTFGSYFNQPIKDCIPFSVTHLTFGYLFNQQIKDCIPLSVTHLIFGYLYNQPIKDCIPSSIKYLEFRGKYQHPIEKSMIYDIVINGVNIKKNEK